MATNGAVDTGSGPPGGGPMGIPMSDLAKMYGGAPQKITEDPAYEALEPLDKSTRTRAELVYRELPLTTVQNTWTVEQARGALYAHMTGIFYSSGALYDSILGDDRVMATLGSRVTGLFGRDVRFEPADDSAAAKECLDAWRDAGWPAVSCGAGLSQLHVYTIGMGFGHAQVCWDTRKPVWVPRLRVWHPTYEYWHWPSWRFRALTLDGEVTINAGDAKWVEHAPYGSYRGWVRGAIRALTEPWMLRHFAFRDMARFSEVHGLPIRKAWTPAVADPGERAQFADAVARLGQETTILLARGVDPTNSDGYDLELLEAKDRSWEVFGGLIDRCDMAIVLALMYQNLTTEVTGGSYAAANVHADIRDSALQGDNAAWRHTIHEQIARPFAWLNFGDPDLAPYTYWDVEPRAHVEGNAKMFMSFAQGIDTLRRGGVEFKDPQEVRAFAAKRFSLDGLPDFTITDPVASGLGEQSKSKLPFSEIDPQSVVSVNEARGLNDLPPISGGDLTVQEYHATRDAERQKEVDDNASENAKEEDDNAADNQPDPPPAAKGAPPGGAGNPAGGPPRGRGSAR